ncbi:unnamed protein product [Brassicogethes aeneus]|uniref:RNA helicase n=1 Tax=Brassicogethes aeneus TaxID=1431903 RepID=A0A9P0BI24_BRAAE|nr:unnamed protein product [Brassicogethes aeneus]
MGRDEKKELYFDFLDFLMAEDDLPNCSLDVYHAILLYAEFMKIEPMSRSKFREISSRMFKNHIILYIRQKRITLSHKLMLRLEYDHVGSENDYNLIENRYMGQELCKLCNTKFNVHSEFVKHKKTERHVTRIMYLTSQVVENNNIKLLDNNLIQFDKITFTQRTKAFVNVKLMNNTTSMYKILDVFQLNTHFDVNLKYLDKLPINCEPKSTICVQLMGTFKEAQDFTLLLGIIMQNSQNTMRVVKKLNIKVKKSLTDQYVKPPITRDDDDDEVIPGEPLPENDSPFIPINKAELHKPPKNTLKMLEEMAKKVPIPRKKCSVDNSQELYATKQNYEKFFHHLLYEEELQMRKDIKLYNTRAPLEFIGFLYRLQVPGLAESRPSLIRGDSVYVKESENSRRKFQGIVHKLEKNSVLLGFNSSIKPLAIRNLKFFIEFSFNRLPIRVEHQACKLVMEHQFIKFLFPELRKLKYGDHKPNYFDRNLNEKQKIAVANILNAPQNSQPYLIFGPPGTGKTSTLVEAIRQIHRYEQNSRILVCGPSNSAVDELALKLLKNIPTSEMLRFVALSYSRSLKDSKLQEIVNVKHGEFFTPTIAQLQKYRIVLTTNINAAKFHCGDVKPNHFNYVIIDEAGYLTETETLVPLAGVLTHQTFKGEVHGKLVLAGDPRQLGPRIHSKTAAKYGFGVSLIERLIDSCELYQPENEISDDINYSLNEKYITLLEMNYRSHQAILKAPNEFFYNDKLIAAEENFSMLFNNWEGLPTKGFPIIFHNVVGEDARDKNSPSFYNAKEVQQVVAYIKMLLDTKLQGKQISQDDIGVITPYRKQIEKLHAETSKNNWNKILVGTVEQFQGKERTIIIISAVRSKKELVKFDKTFDLGFLVNPKRFNVAITRAKSLVILVGNAGILQHDKYWRRYIEYCIENKSVKGAKFILNESMEDLENIDDVTTEIVDFSRGNM